MNETVLELARQAGLKKEHGSDREYIGDFDWREFADLIVRECCQYLENEAERLYSLSAKEDDEVYQANFEICAEKCYDNSQGLKDHFGVEE